MPSHCAPMAWPWRCQPMRSIAANRPLLKPVQKELHVTRNVKLTRIARLATLSLALASAAPVHASQQALMELFKVLRDKGSLTEAEYAMLVKAAQADEAQAASAPPVAAVATA